MSPTCLAELQVAVDESKTKHQLSTGMADRALFLGTEAGEVQKEALKLFGHYGAKAAADAKARLGKEICDLIWNACDLATMAGIELDTPMRAMLAQNKTRTWEGTQP